MNAVRYIVFYSLVIFVLGCQKISRPEIKLFQSVEVKTLIADSLINIRALEVSLKDPYDFFTIYYAGSNGIVGEFEYDLAFDRGFRRNAYYTDFGIEYDSLTQLQFRSIAQSGNGLFVLSIGNPALLFKKDKFKSGFELVYREDHETVFYDSMRFWNEMEGIAMGDPTDDCLSILITRDGGASWRKIPCDALPETVEGEAAFAASDSNIAIAGDKCWIATGGLASRIWYSGDRGKSWEVFDTPVIQGKSTTGLYSLDFYDGVIGYGIGGDYTDPDTNSNNKVLTTDGGRTWQTISGGPGYRSCVQYVPGQQGRGIVAIGFKGIDYSADGGFNWTHLSDEGFYTLRFMNDTLAIAAGRERIALLKFRT